MQRYEQDQTPIDAPSPHERAGSEIGDSAVGTPTLRTLAQESPWSAAGRMLEQAAVAADRVATEAETNARALVTSAQAKADAIVESSRQVAERVAADSARSKEAQASELASERASALAELSDEKAALEAQIATLREAESRYRTRMRQHLQDQLERLDTARLEPPALPRRLPAP